MKLIECEACMKEMSNKAPACIGCGHPNKKANYLSFPQAVGSLLCGAFVLVVIISVASGSLGDFTLASIEDQVAEDFSDQYNIAKRQGDPIQICVQAGLVASGYLQAKDTANYNKWKAKQSSDCDYAGVSF